LLAGIFGLLIVMDFTNRIAIVSNSMYLSNDTESFDT